jgi:hypothetical protein
MGEGLGEIFEVVEFADSRAQRLVIALRLRRGDLPSIR